MNRRVTLAARPEGEPRESDFSLDEAPVPEPGAGEVLVRSHYVSVDPYQRGRMSEARSYAAPLQLGDVVTAQAVGEVVESRDGRFSPGDVVVGQLGWQEYAVARGGTLRPFTGTPITTALHLLGTTGLTAYFGLFDVGCPKPGETVVVSGAAGAVGSIVGQLARIAGCRTVGMEWAVPRVPVARGRPRPRAFANPGMRPARRRMRGRRASAGTLPSLRSAIEPPGWPG